MKEALYDNLILRKSSDCLKNMSVNMDAIQKNVTADQGLIMAEGAVFSLMNFTPREEAAALVSQACQSCVANKSHMIDELKSLSNFDLDWDSLKDLKNHLGDAQQIVEEVIHKHHN